MFRKWQVYMGANDYVDMTEGLDSSMLVTLGQRRRRRVLALLVLVMALLLQVFMQMLKIFRLELLHFRQLMELTFLRPRVVLQMQVMANFILMAS
jgi:hypothetical protein